MDEIETTEKRAAPRGTARASGFWSRVFWLFVLVVVAGIVGFLSLAWMGKRTLDSARDTVIGIAEAFRPEEVVETFEVWREMAAEGTEGNILEVATAEATETFSRKTNLAMFGKPLPLGTTVSEISVPATYRYHIDLNGDWLLTSEGSRLLVRAPRIEPSLPVAFDTAGVRKKTKSGWARWDGDDNLAELEKTVTTRLAERAVAAESIEEVRDESRIAVAKFVRSWLLDREAWGEERFAEIEVRFEGEEERDGEIPVLRLEDVDPAPTEESGALP